MISQSEDFRAAASLARRNYLDSGAANATIEIYDGTRPAAGDPAAGAPLLVVTLAKPCGLVASGSLVLEQNDPAGDLIESTGDASWARFFNGDGEWAFDADASLEGGGGEVQFPDIHLLAGGRVPLLPSAIG